MSVNSQSKFRISACSALGDMSSSHAARATTRAARSPRVARPQFHPPTRRVLRAWVEECRVVVKARLFLLQAQPLSTYVIRTRPTQSPLCRIAVSGAPRVFWLGTHLGAHLPPSIAPVVLPSTHPWGLCPAVAGVAARERCARRRRPPTCSAHSSSATLHRAAPRCKLTVSWLRAWSLFLAGVKMAARAPLEWRQIANVRSVFVLPPCPCGARGCGLCVYVL